MNGGSRLIGTTHKMTMPKSCEGKWTFVLKVVCPVNGTDEIIPAGSYVLDTEEEAKEHVKASADDFLKTQRKAAEDAKPKLILPPSKLMPFKRN